MENLQGTSKKVNLRVCFLVMILGVFLVFALSACGRSDENEEPGSNGNDQGNYNASNQENNQEEDTDMANNEHAVRPQPIPAPAVELNWPIDRAMPLFNPPADNLYAVNTSNLLPDERVTISTLQGYVNRVQPRILLVEPGDIPPFTWAETFGLSWTNYSTRGSDTNSPYHVMLKFQDYIHGIVIYDISQNINFRNVASTIAHIYGFLPVTQTVWDQMQAVGVTVPDTQIIDIRDWEENTSLEMYERVYNEYWPRVTHRLLLSANPGHCFDHARDIIAAVGGAVVWLDTTNAEERELYQRFVRDMAHNPYTALVLGWFTTERSGITAGSVYGVSTVPADYFISGTVFGGITGNADPHDRTIHYPAVPPRAQLENRPYIAVYMTDGDNIQYVQRFMRRLWDQADERQNRGQVPINWTMSPALVDIGPGILNWFYSQASDMEQFVAGPSGMGYLMPTNTIHEPGARVLDFLTEQPYIDRFVSLTERYMEMSGLRVITIWDNATPEVRDAFAEIGRFLYGMTVQNFRDGIVRPGTHGDRLHFARHITHYEGMTETIYRSMRDQLERWDGNSPLFLSYQVKVWANEDGTHTRTPQLVEIYNRLKVDFPEMEWLRADHFFSMFNEANGFPFNLSMNESTQITYNTSEGRLAINGTQATAWEGNIDDSLTLDFARGYRLVRYVVRSDVRYEVEVSVDGEAWITLGVHSGTVDIDIDPMDDIRFMRVTLEEAGRIIEVEAYGRVVN